jgi:DNA modification methylase
MSSNQPSLELPFQRWFKFKEAYSPALVVEILKRFDPLPKTCLDPFGGCGTTALTCQFAGIQPTLIELNPFLADLAEAKLVSYDLDLLQKDYLTVRRKVRRSVINDPVQYLGEAPSTLCEPGQNGRWIFNKNVLSKIISYRQAIARVKDRNNRRILRVILGSILIGCSNVVVNGKGRRYRQNWQARPITSDAIDSEFQVAFLAAISDLQRFSHKAIKSYRILRGSCLTQILKAKMADLAIFSPPYPNSFDYTDIYNIELWVLGYLKTRADNTRLRNATLRSHVQIDMPSRGKTVSTPTLETVINELELERERLWNSRIPEMVRGYFADLSTVLAALKNKVRPRGVVAIVVGDSRYKNVRVPVATIASEIAIQLGYGLGSLSTLRSMRTSAQQGGGFVLQESLIELRRGR